MINNKLTIFLIVFLISDFAGMAAQTEPGYHLKANIKGMPDKTPIHLVLGGDTISSTLSKGGYFEFKGAVRGGANYYFLFTTIQDSTIYSNALWLENASMNISGDFSDFLQLKLDGSTSNEEYQAVQKMGSENIDNSMRLYKEFLKNHTNSLYAPHLLLRLLPNFRINQMDSMYQGLSNRSKQSIYGKELKAAIDIRLKHKEFFERGPLGSIIPDFEFTTLDGKVESLHKIISKNKYTLIDYWASWCRPCRAAVPEMKKVYAEFEGKGFGIIGISIDQNKSDWVKAVKEDQTTWIHVLDDIDNSRKEILSMVAVPGYLIVDEKGKILKADFIASNMARISSSEKNLISELRSVVSEIVK